MKSKLKKAVVWMAAMVLATGGALAAPMEFGYVDTLAWPDTALVDAPVIIADETVNPLALPEHAPMSIILRLNDDLTIVNADNAPLAEVLTALQGLIVPIFSIETQACADAFIAFCEENTIKDGVLMSSHSAVLLALREELIRMPGVLEFLPVFWEVEPPLFMYVGAAHAAYATAVYLNDGRTRSGDEVTYLQKHLTSVWLNVPDDLDTVALHSLIQQAPNGLVTHDTAQLYEAYGQYTGTPVLLRAPQVIGHRGAPYWAPENTLESAILAMEKGGDGIELDIHHTKDNELVVMHDADVQATTNGSGLLRDMTLAQVQTLIANKADINYTKPQFAAWTAEDYPDIRVPTLRAYFDYFKDNYTDAMLYIEIKDTGADAYVQLELLKALLDEYDFYDRVVIISFNLRAQVRRIKELMPQVPLAYLDYQAAHTAKALAHVALPCNAAIDRGAAEIPASEIRALAVRGLLYAGWTYNSAAQDANATAPLFYSNYMTGMASLTSDNTAVGAAIPISLTADADTVTLRAQAEQTLTGYVTYRDGRTEAAEVSVVALDGEGVTVNGGTLKIDCTGETTVLLKTTVTVGGQELALVSQPIAVTILAAPRWLLPVGIVGGLALLGGVGVVLAISARRRKRTG